MYTKSDVSHEAYEEWCQEQGLDPELDYWSEYDEARDESDESWREYMDMIRD